MVEVVSTGVSQLCDNSTVSVNIMKCPLSEVALYVLCPWSVLYRRFHCIVSLIWSVPYRRLHCIYKL